MNLFNLFGLCSILDTERKQRELEINQKRLEEKQREFEINQEKFEKEQKKIEAAKTEKNSNYAKSSYIIYKDISKAVQLELDQIVTPYFKDKIIQDGLIFYCFKKNKEINYAYTILNEKIISVESLDIYFRNKKYLTRRESVESNKGDFILKIVGKINTPIQYEYVKV